MQYKQQKFPLWQVEPPSVDFRGNQMGEQHCFKQDSGHPRQLGVMILGPVPAASCEAAVTFPLPIVCIQT